ncbi:MAG TPA: aconitate hydratase AcnA [Phycisphaerae bacterium]|nr:aconitate hydratase AcnA [Phycisphaerae bacterium]
MPTLNAKSTLATPAGNKTIFRLDAVKALGVANIDKLPYSIKVLLEACLRNLDGFIVTEDAVKALASYNAKNVGEVEIPFMPGRVVLQDFTGVPCVVDLAAMRAAMVRMGGNPKKVNPLVPCDLVIDHSVQVDAFGSAQALTINSKLEFERNTERYQFLKWGQQALSNFRAVPPATGIVHQVNLEYLAKVVWEKDGVLFPDSLVGTDSHTTMINGLGVLGWGVGGIEAEAVMLGQPIYMLIPEVVGFKIIGKLKEGVTATDLVLTITEMLRKHGVVNKFVEFFGPGLAEMPLANRATIANMAPEYGATCGFFPVDEQTLKYLRLTGRDEKLVATIEKYCKEQGFWRNDSYPIEYSSTLELDMSTVEPSVAGPKRPQDRIALRNVKSAWSKELPKFLQGGKKPESAIAGAKKMQSEGGELGGGPIAVAEAPHAVNEEQLLKEVPVSSDGASFMLKHGDVVIAAITSCTNTSNPDVMIAAGIVARKAHDLGLTRKPWVKTSLAPGSKVATEYLTKAGLMPALDAIGFNIVGYGCTTCIGNSGPLPDAIDKAIVDNELVVASVLSGNRNFEGRVHQSVKANYLASPPLVVAYALAGNVHIDITTEPIGIASKGPRAGQPVYLRDIWPTQSEVAETVARCVLVEQFNREYADVFKGSEEWQAISTSTGDLFQWDEKSTYIQEPPFFENLAPKPSPIQPIHGARVLAKLGDSVTTDHISPAGNIKKDSPAGKFLIEHAVPVSMFNSYGSRRGNDRVMTRGTFANTRIKNQIAPGTEGGVTMDYTDGKVKPIYDASLNYKKAGVPLVVLAGKDYGMGSSRDWAAKGTFLLGVKAVIAESFERIHRSNLVGMGVLPLTFKSGQNPATLGLEGTETFAIAIDDNVKPRQDIAVTATKQDGAQVKFFATCRIDTPVEVEYYRNGGILHTVLRKMAAS